MNGFLLASIVPARLSRVLGLLLVLIVAANMSNALRAEERDSPQLSLLEEHRGRWVLDVTRDGRFWIAWVLSKGYLAVYERATGREIMRWPKSKGDWHSLFSPDGDMVVTPTFRSVYSLETVRRGMGIRKLSEGRFTEMSTTPLAAPDSPVVCQTPKGTKLGGIIPLPGMAALGERQDGHSRDKGLGSRILTRLSLKDCAIQASLPMPRRPELAVNSDHSLLAETGTGDGIWLRDLETFEGKIFIPYDGWLVRGFEGLAFEPNGNTLAVLAERTPYRGECDILVYDTETGALLRTIETPSDSHGLAISPDGAMLATAERERRQRWGRRQARAVVGVYDYQTGKQLAHGEFPWEGSEPVDDGGRMQRGFFRLDRAQLIVSTVFNTRIFAIPENLGQGGPSSDRSGTVESTTN